MAQELMILSPKQKVLSSDPGSHIKMSGRNSTHLYFQSWKVEPGKLRAKQKGGRAIQVDS